jgi:hypothetical protein
MSYRNKTYVIFDGDEDMWAYRFMRGWKATEHLDFDFYDAHDIKPITDRACDETIFRRLRERMSNAKQAIVLIGPCTKNLRKFVPWEIGIAKMLALPIVAVNLNGCKQMDAQRCPSALRDYQAIHVAFRMKIIQFALDNYCEAFSMRASWDPGWRYYSDQIYEQLGIQERLSALASLSILQR